MQTVEIKGRPSWGIFQTRKLVNSTALRLFLFVPCCEGEIYFCESADHNLDILVSLIVYNKFRRDCKTINQRRRDRPPNRSEQRDSITEVGFAFIDSTGNHVPCQ
jgi:hypothetical protein